MVRRLVQTNPTTELFDEVSTVVVSTGAADAGKPVETNEQGLIDGSLLFGSLGQSTRITASETIPAGAYVNIYNDINGRKVRLASGVDATRVAHGYTKVAAAANDQVSVYFGGVNDHVDPTGYTSTALGAKLWLSTTTPGVGTLTRPTNTKGNVAQVLGYVDSFDQARAKILFSPLPWVVMAGSANTGQKVLQAHPGGGFQEVYSTWEFTQTQAAGTWTIDHDLGRAPSSVLVLDAAGNKIEASVRIVDADTVEITHGRPTAGSAVLG